MSRDPFDFFRPESRVTVNGKTCTANALAASVERLLQIEEHNPGSAMADASLRIGHAGQPPAGEPNHASCVIGITCDGQCAACQGNRT